MLNRAKKCSSLCHFVALLLRQYHMCPSRKFSFIPLHFVSPTTVLFIKKLRVWKHVSTSRCFVCFKTFFFYLYIFLQTDINMLSIALWWWMECCARLSHFSTEQLLVGLTHTANWYAINLAHSTKAACLLCKGRWAYIKVDWGFRIFLLNERHR